MPVTRDMNIPGRVSSLRGIASRCRDIADQLQGGRDSLARMTLNSGELDVQVTPPLGSIGRQEVGWLNNLIECLREAADGYDAEANKLAGRKDYQEAAE